MLNLSFLDVQINWGGCDKFFQSLWAFIVQIFYRIVTHLFKAMGIIADLLHIAFYMFAGIDTASGLTEVGASDVAGTTNLLQYFLFNNAVVNAYLVLCGIGLLLVFIFTIIKIIKQDFFDKSGPRSKGPIFRNVAISCISFLLVIPIFYILIHLSSVLATSVTSAMGFKEGRYAGTLVFLQSFSDFGTSNGVQQIIYTNNVLQGIDTTLNEADSFPSIAVLHKNSLFLTSASYDLVQYDSDFPAVYRDIGSYTPTTFYWYVYLFGIIAVLGALLRMILAAITRIYKLIGLFLVAPSPISQYVLDDGAKYHNWLKETMQEGLKVVVACMALSIFLLSLTLISRVDFTAPFKNYFSKYKFNVIDILANDSANQPVSDSGSSSQSGLLGELLGNLANAFLRIVMIMASGAAIQDLDAILSTYISGAKSSIDTGAAGKAAAGAARSIAGFAAGVGGTAIGAMKAAGQKADAAKEGANEGSAAADAQQQEAVEAAAADLQPQSLTEDFDKRKDTRTGTDTGSTGDGGGSGGDSAATPVALGKAADESAGAPDDGTPIAEATGKDESAGAPDDGTPVEAAEVPEGGPTPSTEEPTIAEATEKAESAEEAAKETPVETAEVAGAPDEKTPITVAGGVTTTAAASTPGGTIPSTEETPAGENKSGIGRALGRGAAYVFLGKKSGSPWRNPFAGAGVAGAIGLAPRQILKLAGRLATSPFRLIGGGVDLMRNSKSKVVRGVGHSLHGIGHNVGTIAGMAGRGALSVGGSFLKMTGEILANSAYDLTDGAFGFKEKVSIAKRFKEAKGNTEKRAERAISDSKLRGFEAAYTRRTHKHVNDAKTIYKEKQENVAKAARKYNAAVAARKAEESDKGSEKYRAAEEYENDAKENLLARTREMARAKETTLQIDRRMGHTATVNGVARAVGGSHNKIATLRQYMDEKGNIDSQGLAGELERSAASRPGRHQTAAQKDHAAAMSVDSAGAYGEALRNPSVARERLANANASKNALSGATDALKQALDEAANNFQAAATNLSNLRGKYDAAVKENAPAAQLAVIRGDDSDPAPGTIAYASREADKAKAEYIEKQRAYDTNQEQLRQAEADIKTYNSIDRVQQGKATADDIKVLEKAGMQREAINMTGVLNSIRFDAKGNAIADEFAKEISSIIEEIFKSNTPISGSRGASNPGAASPSGGARRSAETGTSSPSEGTRGRGGPRGRGSREEEDDLRNADLAARLDRMDKKLDELRRSRLDTDKHKDDE